MKEKVSFEKGSPYFNMFGDYYHIVQTYINGDKDGERPDSYWTELIDVAGAFAKRYDFPFAFQLILKFLDEVDHRDKAERAEKKSLISA